MKIMKNTNGILKTIKTSSTFKLLTLWFNKIAKLANLKPKQLIILLGLLLVSLATLGLGMLGGNKEGYSTMSQAKTDSIRIIDAMNCAINNSTTVQSMRDTMRNKINKWFSKYINYLEQGADFNVKNNMDISGNKNGKIYKIKDDTDINGNTMPKYIDDEDTSSISDLTKYELVYVYDKGNTDVNGDKQIYKVRDETLISDTMPKYIDNGTVLPATTSDGTPNLTIYYLIDIKTAVDRYSVDDDELNIINYFDTVTSTPSKVDTLNEKFSNLKNFAEEYYILMSGITSTGIEGYSTNSVNDVLNKGTEHTVTGDKNVDPCDTGDCSGSGCGDGGDGDGGDGDGGQETGVGGGSSIDCVGNWSNIGSCEDGYIKKKYKVMQNASNDGAVCGYLHNEVRNFTCVDGEEEEDSGVFEIPESITNPDILRDYLYKIENDFTNADKWKKLYITELKRRNKYIKYVNSHNFKYHHTDGETRPQYHGSYEYENLTGTGKVGVPAGDEDLYMLKSRMVPPTNPPGSGNGNGGMQQNGSNGNGNGNGGMQQNGGNGNGGMQQNGGNGNGGMQQNSSNGNGSNGLLQSINGLSQGLSTGSGCNRPATVPPCPPCERCPEPAFDCKRVPNYNSVTSNEYLPRPVLNDFSQFGM